MRIKTEVIDATPYLPPVDIRNFHTLAPEQVTNILNKAAGLKETTVMHISASRLREDLITGKKYIGGGGLAETLRDQIPLESSCGFQSLLYLPSAQSSFYLICQRIFSQIIGATDYSLSSSEVEEYVQTCANLQPKFLEIVDLRKPDIVVIHDFEFLPLIKFVPRSCIKILHWHVDFPYEYLNQIPILVPYLKEFDMVIVADEEISRNISRIIPKIQVIPPSINPQANKLLTPTPDRKKQILKALGIYEMRPIVTQIGRISNQKDPISAVKIFKLVRERFPGIQLVLAGMFNLTGEDFDNTLRKLKMEIGQDKDIHLFLNTKQIMPFSNDELLAALYSSSDILINMSKNEGFGLVMTEAMWHGNIVVAMDSPGARTQIDSGHNGFIISDLTQAVEKVGNILREPDKFKDIKEHAKQSVRDRFLITNYVENMIDLYKSLQKNP